MHLRRREILEATDNPLVPKVKKRQSAVKTFSERLPSRSQRQDKNLNVFGADRSIGRLERNVKSTHEILARANKDRKSVV